MSPKYVDKNQKAREITQAALEVFSQKGYTGTSVDEIATTAGIAKGTVYEYFPSKDSLYIAALMVFVEEFENVMEDRLAPIEDPFLRLVEYVGLSIEFASQENATTVRTMFDILQQSALENGVFFKRKYLVREMMSGYRSILTDILLDGISKGVFQKHIARDAEKLATNIIAYLDGASLHNLITENYFDMPEQLILGMRFLASFILVNPNDYDVDELITQAVGR
jgi:TetR/AcrR family acrAB operon transcriptional repressor